MNATPRKYEEARDWVRTYVSDQQLNEALSSVALKVMLERNIKAYGMIGENSRLPVLIKPGMPMVIGRIEDQSVLKDFLRGYVEKKKKPEETDVWAEDAEDVLE